MDILSFFSKTKLLKPEEVRKWLKEKKEGEFTLVDVRQPAEYESGHLPGAVLMPLPELLNRLSEMDCSKPVITY